MATQDLEKLIVKLDADLRSYERALAKAQGVTTTQMRKIEREVQTSATRVEGTINKMGLAFASIGKGFLAAIGIGSVKAFADTVQTMVSETAKVGDLADRIGLGTDALQGLQYGAVAADMSFEDLDKTLLRFSKTLGEAANGQSDYLKTLRANGQEVQGNTLDNLKQLAELVKNAKNEQEALLIITQAMGKGSDGWLEVLSKGAAGIDELTRASKEAGATLDRDLIKKMQQIDDDWAQLTKSMSTRFKDMILENVANFQTMVNALKDPNAKSALRQVMENLGIAGNLFEAAIPNQRSRSPFAPTLGGGQTSNVAAKGDFTKVFNPEEDAEKRRKLAEALREEKRARDELARTIKQHFEAFTSDLTRADEDVAALKLEAATLGLTTGEIDRQRLAQELLNSANREGIPITDGVNQVIQEKAKAYGDAAQALEDLQKQQALIDELNGSVKDSFSSFLSDLRSGVEPVEALTNALGRLAERLTDLAIDTAFTALTKPGGAAAGGIGGALMSIFQHHRGGVVGRSGSARRVSPAVFAGARRMHSGGLAGDEVPAILQKGEMVLPKGYRGGGGSGFAKVVVNNYGGQVQQRETRGPGGERMLEIQFNSMFDRRLGSQSTQKILGAGYGLRPKVTRR